MTIQGFDASSPPKISRSFSAAPNVELRLLLACRAVLTVQQLDNLTERAVHGAKAAVHLIAQAAHVRAQVKLILAEGVECASVGPQLGTHFRDVPVGTGREHSRGGCISRSLAQLRHLSLQSRHTLGKLVVCHAADRTALLSQSSGLHMERLSTP